MTGLVMGSLLACVLAGIAASLRWNWWRPARSGIPVLMYHKIGVAPAGSKLGSLWVSRERFTWQMRWLKEHGYTTVTFADLARGVKVDRPVIVTFDDGYKNQYSEGFAILRGLGMKGVFYIVTDTVGKENLWHDPKSETLLPMMQESDVRTIAESGHEIGSHTLSHHRMESLTPEQVVKELAESKRRLETITGSPMVSFAFPYGNGEDRPDLMKAVYDAGYRWAIGIHGGIWDRVSGRGERPHPRAIPRIFVRGDDCKLDFYIQMRCGRSRV